jgi:hypothetical protein
MRRKIYRHKYSVVTIANEPLFKLRCDVKLQSMGITPTTEALPILGTLNLVDKSKEGQYIPKLRTIVAFLLDQTEYDESLILFYPYTPKGIVTCQDKPVALCLLSKMGTKGTPLEDTNVKSPCRRVVQCMCCVCAISE